MGNYLMKFFSSEEGFSFYFVFLFLFLLYHGSGCALGFRRSLELGGRYPFYNEFHFCSDLKARLDVREVEERWWRTHLFSRLFSPHPNRPKNKIFAS